MTSIRAFSEILRDTKRLSGAEKTRYASIIHAEAERLTRLLNDLLDLSVLESGAVSLKPEHGTLDAVLDRAVTTALAGSPGKIEVQRNAKSEAVAMFTDLDRLGQVFINLITNAQKYCDADAPCLIIAARAADGDCEVTFRDNGSGIARDAEGLMFEKFSRLGRDGGDGAGLGLAICREIMNRLGGTITYEHGEAGAAFRVTLPTGMPPGTQARQGAAKAAHA